MSLHLKHVATLRSDLVVKTSCSKIDLISKCNDYKLLFLEQFMLHSTFLCPG